MPFTKNDKNINTKGRKKNVPNKNTALLKELITETIQENYNNFNNRLNKLNDKDFVQAYISVLKYVLPTLKAMEVKENTNEMPKEFQIEIITKNQNK